ncbi:hypothetical protein B0I37DRAFT_187408 [Chaetomium sp. MPI-CAGE-AT-0009]|nr:hypothetical protein B0I37DRAFT_187408 [Chaetomium sp. MPI-CAGE-AT-0009]
MSMGDKEEDPSGRWSESTKHPTKAMCVGLRIRRHGWWCDGPIQRRMTRRPTICEPDPGQYTRRNTMEARVIFTLYDMDEDRTGGYLFLLFFSLLFHFISVFLLSISAVLLWCLGGLASLHCQCGVGWFFGLFFTLGLQKRERTGGTGKWEGHFTFHISHILVHTLSYICSQMPPVFISIPCLLLFGRLSCSSTNVSHHSCFAEPRVVT